MEEVNHKMDVTVLKNDRVVETVDTTVEEMQGFRKMYSSFRAEMMGKLSQIDADLKT